jgi:hypothetical protein
MKIAVAWISAILTGCAAHPESRHSTALPSRSSSMPTGSIVAIDAPQEVVDMLRGIERRWWLADVTRPEALSKGRRISATVYLTAASKLRVRDIRGLTKSELDDFVRVVEDTHVESQVADMMRRLRPPQGEITLEFTYE